MPLLISTHAIQRFRERMKDAFQGSTEEMTTEWCEARIRGMYNRSTPIDINSKTFRPWLTSVTLADNEELMYDRGTKAILIVKHTHEGAVVKTIFRAVCKTCGGQFCKHYDQFMRELCRPMMYAT